MKDCDYFIYKELISYENEKMKTRFRNISPIRKNTSANNFYTNINFYTNKFINKKDSRNEKLYFQLNKNKKDNLIILIAYILILQRILKMIIL